MAYKQMAILASEGQARDNAVVLDMCPWLSCPLIACCRFDVLV